MKIGISKIGFYAPKFYIEQSTLAQARNIDPNKFTQGLGQQKMAICPITQDVISMGANASLSIIDDEDRMTIDLVILATESGVDYSKAGATTIHQLLKIQPKSRCLEIKQACYGLTAALQYAHAYIATHPLRKALVVGSDISRYGLNTSGEPTQGAGAVAMIISSQPKIASFSLEPAFYSEDIYDFFRPEHREFAIVDGHYSNEKYLEFFNQTSSDFAENNKIDLETLKAICFHIPYSKIGLKALGSRFDEEHSPHLFAAYKAATYYNQHIGNIYTGSLYLSLISLLESKTLQSGDNIGLFSYGSGAVGEFFQMTLEQDYQHHLNAEYHQKLLSQREACTIEQYEDLFTKKLEEEKENADDQPFYLKGIFDQKRVYHQNT